MGTHYKGLHGEAPPDMITFFRLQVHIYENVGISGGWGGGGTPYDGLIGKALPERGTFSMLQVYERVVVSLVGKRVGKSVIACGL